MYRLRILAGIKTVKSLAIEPVIQERFRRENKKFYDYSLRASKLTAVYGNIPFLVTAVAMSGMLYYGGHAIISGALLGVMWSLVYLITRNLWAVAANHAVWNFTILVTGLPLTPAGTVNLSQVPTPLVPLTLPHGSNGMENATFTNCGANNRIEVRIVTDDVLDFQPNSYFINCTDNNASQWTGVGQTGNILEVKPTVNKAGKMEW